MDLKNIVVIITGGGTGIGRATALAFSKYGANVIVCGRRPEPLMEVTKIIEQQGGKVLALPVDVRNWYQVDEMVNRVLQRFGRIDILVNNAGINLAKAILDTTEEEWDEVLDINLKGIFLCCKAVLPSMLKCGNGIIVNVSSSLVKAGIANMSAYCASKAGVIGLTQSLADELKSQKIRVYAVCPGPTYTEMHSKISGETVARQSMPAEKVALKILGLVTGKIPLASGVSIVVDEQPLPYTLNKIKYKCKQRIRRSFRFLVCIYQRMKINK